MRYAGLIYVILGLFAPLTQAVTFSLVDGLNSYEVLGLERTATDEEVRAKWASKIKSAHSDRTQGSDELTKRYNAAYENLKPAVRKKYDTWLGGGSNYYHSEPQAPGRTDEEEIELTYKYILRKSREDVEAFRKRGEPLTTDRLSFAGRFTVAYGLRYMPGTTYTPEQLMDFIFNYALSRKEDSRENRVGNHLAALGAMTFLKEYLEDPFYREQTRTVLRQLENKIRAIVDNQEEDAYTRMLAKSWEFLTDRPYTRARREVPVQTSDCEQSLKATVTVRGADGRLYEIPIKVEVKFGR